MGTTALVVSLGWRAGFIGPGLWCAAVAIVLFFTMRERPEALGLPKVDEWTAREEQRPLEEEPKKPNEKKLTTRQLQFQVLRTPALWVLGLASACMYFTRYAIDSWGLFYLQEAKGYTLTQAGWIMGLNTMAGIVGCIAYGFISDRLFAGRRPPLTLIFGLFEVLALCAIFFIPPGYPGWERAAFILYGFTLSGLLATLGGLFAIDIAPKATAGAAMGMIGVFSYVSAAIQEHVSGYLIEDGMTMVDSVRVYDFSSVILLWVGASVLSVVLASTLWRVKVQA